VVALLNAGVSTVTQTESAGQCDFTTKTFNARQEAFTLAQSVEQYRSTKPANTNYGMGSYTICYSEIANGGFGPGGGFYGIAGGYGSTESGTHTDDIQTLINRYEGRSYKRLVDLSEHAQQKQSPEKPLSLLIPYGEWWQELLPICDLGCVQEVCIDSQERLFVVAPIDSNEVYWLSQLPWTLEEWLWRWIRNEDLMEPYPLGAA